MKFWDASAIVPLIVAEAVSDGTLALADRDPEMLVWWGTEVECASAVTRRERGGGLDADSARSAFERLGHLADHWLEIEPGEIVRETALRFLRVHPLRAADALQLAAAFVGADRRPAHLEFVTFDERLAEAARKEGFMLVDMAT
ncbi:MAG TPA: type II toxin-antitoxin system VapC family toxin [Rhizomicrobium sp.]|nr:type II toxin-antitoxin system VapC family toxin [Rhizomicrobium sp.]